MGFMNRRNREEQIIKEGRLPPGQSLTEKFPVLHYGPAQTYPTLDNWTFRVFGLVDEEKTWSWEQFNNLPQREVNLDLHCVTRWSKFDTVWRGVHVKDLIDEGFIKLKPEVKFCIQHCDGGYTTNTPIDAVLAENFLLAFEYDGKPLPVEHGYPLRGLMGAVPGQKADVDLYLWKGGKWLRGLEFSATDKPGFWENAGYHNNGNVWAEERFSRRGFFF